MEKDLLKILQEIKIELNKLKIEDRKKEIQKLNKKLDRTIDNYNRYSKKQFYIRVKYLLFSSITLGIYSYLKSNKVREKIEELENYMTQEENEYNILNIEIVGNEVINEINQNIQKELIKNYDQISNFLQLCDNMDEQEKESVLTYKMGVEHE